MQRYLLGILPAPILYKVFQRIAEDEPTSTRLLDKDMESVSHYSMAMTSGLPIKSAIVSMTSQSLSDLEKLCRHPNFSKSITQITLDTSYYDKKLAMDRRQYARNCASELNMSSDIEERSSFGGAISRGESYPGIPDRATMYFDMADELDAVDTPDFKISSATKYQKCFLQMHEKYVEHWKDQEEVRSNNDHIRRICTCLSSLSTLRQLKFSDTSGGDDSVPVGKPDIREMYGIGMYKSGWRGFFETAWTTEPPVEMLGELMSQLGKSGIRPEQVEIDHNVPVDLRYLQVSEEQSEGIRDLVSQCSEVAINLRGLDRPIDPNNRDAVLEGQSREEMLAIGVLSKALTSARGLKSLRVRLDEYSTFSEHPPVNLSDFFPIRSMKWSELERVSFEYLPFDMDDMAVFVSSHRGSVKDFKATSMYLRDGDWDQALDILRQFNALESVELMYPNGGRYKDWHYSNVPRFPQEEAEQYVRQLTSQNPLQMSPRL